MSVSIQIAEDNNAGFVVNRSATANNWNFIPPALYFYWLMSDPAPADFTQQAEFPAFDTITSYSNYTDWQFEVSLQYDSTVPFCKVEGGQTYSGGLGTPFSNGGDFYRKSFTLGFQNLNLLSEGQYYCRAICSVTAKNGTTGLRELISDQELLIEFQASAFLFAITSPFEVAYAGRQMIWGGIGTPITYTPMVFNYHVGDPLPTAQDLFYFRCKLATSSPIIDADAEIATTHVPIHAYFSKVAVGFTSAILSYTAGVYEFDIELSYFSLSGYVGATVHIVLNVLPPAASFTITPGTLETDVVIGGPTPQQMVLSVASSSPWSITSLLPSWLQLSQISGAANATVLATVVNYADLASGDYSFNLYFQSGGDTIIVPITIHVVAFLKNPFAPGKLYFTKALDYLEFSTPKTGTYIDLSLSVKCYKINTNEEVVYLRDYKIALFEGKAKFHVGTVVHTLFDEIDKLEDYVPDTGSNYYRNQYQPAEITASFQETDYVEPFGGPSPGLVSNTLGTFKMIKGHRPFMTSGQLALLTTAQQEVTRISPRSTVAVSFVHFNTPRVVVKINNIAVEDFMIPTFSPNGLQKLLYTYYRFVNDLRPGDNLEITIIDQLESRSQRYLVMRPGSDSTFFLFENDNRVLEAFEFTGRRRIESKYEHQSNKKFVDLYEYDQKAVTKKAQTITINTGQLTKTEHRILDALIVSKNVWCCLDHSIGPYLRVDSFTTKLQNQDTFLNEEDFDIEFNILENTDAVIYPL